jgi:threonine synthase
VHGAVVPNPETVATAIRIGNPARWQEAVAALDESDGTILAVEDAEILECWRMLSTLEGVFVEPASAAGVASLRKAIKTGEIDVRDQHVVCVVTGHGLKDPAIVLASADKPRSLPAEFDALAAYIMG